MKKIFTKQKFLTKLLQILNENKKTLLFLTMLTVLLDIFFISTSSDVLIFSIIILYSFFSRILSFSSKATFIFCLVILFIMTISYAISYTSVTTEKAAVWLVLFLAVGILQQWKE